MTFRLGRLRTLLVAVVLGAMMFALGIFFTRGGPADPAAPSGRTSTSAPPLASSSGADLAQAIGALQERLRRLPEDHTAWAALGTAYVQQAAVTGDPSFYAKAEGALRRSLEVEPDDNAAALTGQAALAAAKHDFPLALEHAQAAKRINPYSAANQGILTDALQQLGRYGRARVELQRMLDLQPGVPSFTRTSYTWELDGERRAAEMALRRALELADRPSDRAYCLYYLGELAWNSGEFDEADRFYARGLREDPSYTPLLAGRAKVAAARGDVEKAVDRYAEVVQRLPVPTYLIAYADLLRSLGRDGAAAQQEAVVAATRALFEEQGASVDLEFAVFDADRGRGQAALTTARSMWREQRSIEAADAYGWALHAVGRDRAALRYALLAGRLGTKSALFAYHRGMIQLSLGRSGEARESLREALSINPAFSPLHAPRARAALEKLRT